MKNNPEQTRGGEIVSSHFMHRINREQAGKMFSAEQFAAKALSMTPTDIKENLIPKLKQASKELVKRRANLAESRAKQNYQDYGLSSKDKITSAEILTEAITDSVFRKTKVSPEDKKKFRDTIAEKIAVGEKIRLVVPMLPNKIDSPLKSRGILPGIAEAGVIARLGEIASIVNKLYPKDKLKGSGSAAEFIIVGDGRLFADSFNTRDEDIQSYQNGINWWIKTLGVQDIVTQIDYEETINKLLPEASKSERSKHYDDIIKELTDTLDPLLDVNDFDRSMRRTSEKDPLATESNPRGLFVPLFKSTMYNIRYPALELYAKNTDMNSYDYSCLYREITRNIDANFVELDENRAEEVGEYILHDKKDSTPPSEAEIKEYLRQSLISTAWESTKKYCASMLADRRLDIDPIADSLGGDIIRFTIHTKSGQIDLKTSSSDGDPVQAWHGEGVFRKTRMNAGGKKGSNTANMKISNEPVLKLEAEGCIPVLVKSDNEPAKDDLLSKLAEAGQPLFYIHPDTEFYDPTKLIAAMEEKLVRV